MIGRIILGLVALSFLGAGWNMVGDSDCDVVLLGGAEGGSGWAYECLSDELVALADTYKVDLPTQWPAKPIGGILLIVGALGMTGATWPFVPRLWRRYTAKGYSDYGYTPRSANLVPPRGDPQWWYGASAPLGAGWWQASDGKWYPPERRPPGGAETPPTGTV